MARVAVVTGGTRGIGEAISVALKDAGYQVAANYGGNDEAARAFNEKTGIPVYKWDVADFQACQDGIAKVEADLGPIEVLVNNAGITRDTTLHRMKPEQWSDVIRTNLNSVFNMTRGVIEGMRERGFGRIVNISSINGQKGQFGQSNYSAAKAGLIGFTKAVAQENARQGRHGERGDAGLHRHRDGARGARGRAEVEDPAADPGGAPGRARGGGTLRGVPGQRRGGFHHRLDALGQWRPVHELRDRSGGAPTAARLPGARAFSARVRLHGQGGAVRRRRRAGR